MASIDEFLSQFSDRIASTGNAESARSDTTNVVLNGILLGTGETSESVVFSHLGLLFQVRKEDVIEVDESSAAIPNPFGKGVACALSLLGDAMLVRSTKVLAKDLASSLPFVVSRPSQIQPFSEADYQAQTREVEWLENRGLTVPTAEQFQASGVDPDATTYTGTQSSQVTATRTNTQSSGMSDDSAVDDTPSDSMGRDDASPDDMTNERAGGAPAPEATTYTGTQSSQVTATRTNTQSAGMSDDSAVDDTPSDSMGRDDASPDDMSNDKFEAAVSPTTTYTGTQSSQTTSTRTNTQSAGMSDDSAVDDTPSDSMGRDDASPDDM
jgi:hypothetical protein